MTPAMKTIPQPKPWFHEPWPWLLAGGPLMVVVASLVSAWIAIRSSDGLVNEDYYRAGLAVEETISRSQHAEALGLSARMYFARDMLSVALSARDASFAPPSALRITLSHPTRAGLDQTLVLPREGDRYVLRQPLPASGHWLVLIEDAGTSWRMMGSVVLPLHSVVVIGAP